MHNRLARYREEREGGFTLIELLVVIIIIGILAAIAIPVFLNQRKKAVDASEKSDLRTLANQMETYFTDFQVYPAASTVTQSGTTITVGTGGDTTKSSAGNVITVVSIRAAGSYCLKSTNTNGTSNWFYDSANGGLLPKGSTCT